MAKAKELTPEQKTEAARRLRALAGLMTIGNMSVADLEVWLEQFAEFVQYPEPKPFYGSVNFMPERLLRDQLTDAKATVIKLTEEVMRRSKFTPAELLADRLHSLLHRGVDCDYYYSDWGIGTLTTCRAEFKAKAERLLDGSDSGIVGRVITILEGK